METQPLHYVRFKVKLHDVQDPFQGKFHKYFKVEYVYILYIYIFIYIFIYTQGGIMLLLINNTGKGRDDINLLVPSNYIFLHCDNRFLQCVMFRFLHCINRRLHCDNRFVHCVTDFCTIV